MASAMNMSTSAAAQTLLVAGVRRALGNDTALPLCSEEILSEALALAERNKLVTELATALADWGVSPSVGLLAAIARYRMTARRKADLAHRSLLAVGGALDTAGIPWIAYKGVVTQIQLGLGTENRPSNDLDILVRRNEFDEALRVLSAAGCTYEEQYATPWWRLWLGEVPVAPPGRNGLTIDLHNKLQQPGCPAPRHTSLWVESRCYVDFNGLPVPTAEPVAMALLSAINVIKALAHHECAGSHAVVLCRFLLNEVPRFHSDVESFARQQGLTQTLVLARHVASALIGTPLPGSGAPVPMEHDWIDLMLCPLKDVGRGPRHRSFLWALSEGRSLAKLARFARDSLTTVSSEWVRRQEQIEPS